MPAVDEILAMEIERATPLVFRHIQDGLEKLEHLEPESTPPDSAPDLETRLRAAYEDGRREALNAAQHDLAARMELERESVSRSLQQFSEEKARYFRELEAEVVRLSLAVAAHVLHREAEMDPTLLMGAARIALERIADSSETVLRVAAREEDRWSELAATRKITLEVDESLAPGEAVLRTRSGTVELGIRAQLQEIERGFFELLARRRALAV